MEPPFYKGFFSMSELLTWRSDMVDYCLLMNYYAEKQALSIMLKDDSCLAFKEVFRAWKPQLENFHPLSAETVSALLALCLIIVLQCEKWMSVRFCKWLKMESMRGFMKIFSAINGSKQNPHGLKGSRKYLKLTQSWMTATFVMSSCK